MSPPPIPSLLWSHWELSWGLDAEALIVAGLYLWATRRVRRGWPARRTLSFLAGLGAILVALQSGIGAFDDRLLSVHMVQHLVLLQLAPILLLGGRPARLALLALPPTQRQRIGRRLPHLGRPASAVLGLGAFAAVVLGTHLPSFYDATLRHPVLHQAEHGLYLLCGLLLWWPVIGDDPAASRRLNGFGQLAYIVVAMLPMALIGAYLSRAPTLFYPAYAAPARALGTSAVIDQQHAGAIMWVAGGTLMVAVVLWTAMRAMIEDERRQRTRDLYAAGGEPRVPGMGTR